MLRDVCKEAGYTDYANAERFNRVFDTDKALQMGLSNLVTRYGELTESQYVSETLELCRQAGLELTSDELHTQLHLRMKYQQRLLEAQSVKQRR